jgi:hypothetical protein
MGVVRRFAKTARPSIQPVRRLLEAFLGFAEAVRETADRFRGLTIHFRESVEAFPQ